MRDSPLLGEGQQVPGLVPPTPPAWGDRDLAPLRDLLVGIAQQSQAARRVHGLYEPRAVDPPLGSSSPQIRRPGEPAQSQLGVPEMARFSAQLALRPHLPLSPAAVPSVVRSDAAAGPQRDSRPAC